MRRSFAVIFTTLTVAACAKDASQVGSTYISIAYDSYSCPN